MILMLLLLMGDFLQYVRKSSHGQRPRGPETEHHYNPQTNLIQDTPPRHPPRWRWSSGGGGGGGDDGDGDGGGDVTVMMVVAVVGLSMVAAAAVAAAPVTRAPTVAAVAPAPCTATHFLLHEM